MKNRFLEERLTGNSTVFKRLWLRRKLDCPICGPNRGCNFRNKRKQKSWKVFRKTRWKDL